MPLVKIITFSLIKTFSFIRRLIDVASDIAFGYYYSGKKQQLPPIKSQYLLEPATDLAKKIRKGEIKSQDLVKAFITRVRDVQPLINAISDERFQQALEEAKRVDELIMSKQKTEEQLAKEMPFLGIPISVKEAIAVKGMLFTTGLVSRKGVRATEDSDNVALMRKAGAIPLVVTNTSELCLWWECNNYVYGRTNNPYDTTRIVGGSSGGEGALIASGGSVLGIGNDIGGSIRIPSFFNGIFGHKPSRGIVPNRGQFPLVEGDMQTYLSTGPMCRFASDLRLSLKVLAGNSVSNLKLDTPMDLKNLKVYYMEDDGGNPLHSRVDPEIKQAQRKVISYLHNMYGIKAEKVHLTKLRHSFQVWCFVMAAADVTPLTVELSGRKGDLDPVAELVKWLLGLSQHILPVIILSILNKLLGTKDMKQVAPYFRVVTDLYQEFQDMLGNDGVFLYPSHPEPAPYHNQPLLKPFNVTYTTMFNLLGLPVTQCPLGLSNNGLPIGLQVIGGLYNDHLTITLAEELEKAFGGWVNPCPSV